MSETSCVCLQIMPRTLSQKVAPSVQGNELSAPFLPGIG